MDSAIRKGDWTRAPCKRAGLDNCRLRTNSPESWVYFPLILFFGTDRMQMTLATSHELFCQPRQLSAGPIRQPAAYEVETAASSVDQSCDDGFSFGERPTEGLAEELGQLEPSEQIREFGHRCRYTSQNLVTSESGKHRTITALSKQSAEGIGRRASQRTERLEQRESDRFISTRLLERIPDRCRYEDPVRPRFCSTVRA